MHTHPPLSHVRRASRMQGRLFYSFHGHRDGVAAWSECQDDWLAYETRLVEVLNVAK